MGRIKVFLIESRQIFRMGLLRSLASQKDMEIQGVADNLETALPILEELPPYSVVICGDFPPQDWRLIYQFKLRLPTISFLAMADLEQEELLFQALEAGAEAFLSKKADGSQLAETIRQVFLELSPITSSIATHRGIATLLLQRFNREAELYPGLRPMLAPLTPRERQLLWALAHGNPPQEEGETLRKKMDIIRRKLVANHHILVTFSLLMSKRMPIPSELVPCDSSPILEGMEETPPQIQIA